MENNNEYYPQKLWVCQIQSSSFTAKTFSKMQKRAGIDPDWLNKSITNWDIKDIKTKGLYLIFDNIFVHNTSNLKISCEHMVNSDTNNPLKCPIYYKMMHSNIYNEGNLYHLEEYTHFTSEYFQKPQCKFSQNCVSYKRMEQGKYRFSDICHLKLYKHPVRSNKTIRQQQNMKQLFSETNAEENNGIYPPVKGVSSLQSGIYGLLQEVTTNGYKSDLFFSNNDRKHKHFSILDAVNEKHNCYRHNAMGKPLNKVEILALFLYTNGECSYNLCEAQRNGNYKKWKLFDYYLYQAIYKLNKVEMGKYKLYSGLTHTQMTQKQLSHCYFTTYASMTWIKDIIMSFVGEQGMLIEMDEITRKNMICCDVSWVSKFPDEFEVIIARSIRKYPQSFDCSVDGTDTMGGIQMVKVQNTFNKKSEMKAYFKMQRKRNNIDSIDPERQPYGELKMLNQELGIRYSGYVPVDDGCDYYYI